MNWSIFSRISQTAHLLLLKGLRDNADVRFENQLRNSAIHVADRERLYKLLNVAPEPLDKMMDQGNKEEAVVETPVEHLPAEQVAETPVEIPVIEPVPEVPMEMPAIEPVAESPVETPYSSGNIQMESGDNEQVVIEQGRNSEDLINEFEKRRQGTTGGRDG